MTWPPISGAEGYAEDVERLISLEEKMSAGAYHQPILHLIPEPPSRILDIGAGTGRDAAWFADMGHRVVAVEPTDGLRAAAQSLHPSPAIEWLDDALPELAALRQRDETFDVVMLTAVLHHLDKIQRRAAMPNLAALLRRGGVLILTLRRGPSPASRRTFVAPAEETIATAVEGGLRLVFNAPMESVLAQNRAAGVNWTRLAFEKR